MEVRW